MVLFEAQVEFPYDATAPDELTLRPGQVIKVVSLEDEGWWKGELNGKVGMFPNNFVKKITTPAAGVAPPPAARPSAAAPPASSRKAKATFEYTAADADELTLRIGDIVTVLGEESEGWWRAELNGKKGLVPSNFVQEISADGSAIAAPAEEEGTENKLKKIGVPMGGIGGLFTGGVPQLKKRNTVVDLAPAPVAAPAPAASQPPPGRKVPPVTAPAPAVAPSPAAAAAAAVTAVKIRKARATFAYQGADADELSLAVGDVVTVTGDDVEGWWRGTNALGISGVFPNNFVEEFFETVAAPPRGAKPDSAPAAVAPKPSASSRLSRPEPEAAAPAPASVAAPATSARPGVVAKPGFPKPAETSTGGADSAAPAFEKKKFSTPAAAGRPTAAPEVDDELAKKLSVRSAASESDDGAPAPKPAAAEPSLYQRPPVAAAPKPVAQKPSVAAPPTLPVVIETPAANDPESPADDLPKLHHATKDRPKIGSNRRKPQRRSFSSGAGNNGQEDDDEEEEAPKPAGGSAASLLQPKLPDRPVVADKAPPETKVPDRPKPALAPSPAAAKSSSSDGQSIAELKEWFVQELNAVKKDLQEERALRRLLEERVAKLESKK